MSSIERSSGAPACCIEVGHPSMGHAPESEFLESLKKRLTELENLRLLSPDDLKIVSERRTLRGQIAELERLELAPPQVAAASFIAIAPKVEQPSSFFRGRL